VCSLNRWSAPPGRLRSDPRQFLDSANLFGFDLDPPLTSGAALEVVDGYRLAAKNERDAKSCGPQLFAEGEPSNEWGLEELGVYAQIQYHQILDGEKLLTPTYWRLGHVLVLAKKAFKHGKWSQYLKSLGIDATRASKARAIYRTFNNAEEWRN